MTTEIQIRKSRNYLPHLCKVVAYLAARLGMSRNEAQETEEAVNEICVSSIEAANGSMDYSLSIRLDAQDDRMTVEISDPACAFTPTENGQWLIGATSAGTFRRVRRLADEVEFVPARQGTTIRVTKYARRIGAEVAASRNQLPTSTLHV